MTSSSITDDEVIANLLCEASFSSFCYKYSEQLRITNIKGMTEWNATIVNKDLKPWEGTECMFCPQFISRLLLVSSRMGEKVFYLKCWRTHGPSGVGIRQFPRCYHAFFIQYLQGQGGTISPYEVQRNECDRKSHVKRELGNKSPI